MAKTVLAFLPEGFEEIEFVTPVDIWRRAGFEVTVAALSAQMAVTGRSNMTLMADVDLDSVAARDFDCVFCPGGPGTKLLREDSRVIEIVKRHAAASKKIAAICAAPTVLKVAGVLPEKYTAHFSVATDLPEIAPLSSVVSGHFITSQGAGTSVDFGLKVVTELVGKDKADEVSKAICFGAPLA
eukprot:CAMPEP_0173087448 /NCGR_PEP_ID=MMETSP1102-20130122/23892_1 /TAXON_ID=49646 /ORGANISM="Geminigera sp., Strain Caron Lab Isolate" /LENGTH=183 /DNA_ID=CAMNT_0013969257 /DNA_START=92 /DNA_END=643 /DNA_ORIENTATION=-